MLKNTKRSSAGKNNGSSKRRIDPTTVAAWVALVIAGAQLFVTTPQLIGLVVHPILVAEDIKSDTGIYRFKVVNKGNAAADNVEVSVLTFENDQVDTLPKLGSLIEKQGEGLSNFRIVVPRLNPDEEFIVVVVSPATNAPDTARAIVGNEERIIGPIPSISVLRSDYGPGEIKARRFTGWGDDPVQFRLLLPN